MDIVLAIHSFVRWIIMLVAVVAIVKLALGWLRGGAFDGLDRGLVAGRASPAPVRYRASLAAIGGSLVLIVIGIFIIASGHTA